ncbi:DUF5320 domain-containing protein [bacterium]|nr:DUF5320 domain-containing protein [bacterium]
MPGRNRTGPQGEGPMTGRGAGLCNGNSGAGNGMGRGRGLGLGRGQGRGRGNGMGFGNGFGNNSSNVNNGDKEELSLLRDQTELLTQELQNVQKKLAEMNDNKSSDKTVKED